MDNDIRAMQGLTFLLLLFVLFYCQFLGCRIITLRDEQDKIKLWQEWQQEQVKESTVTCPRCMKEFELDEQPPEYKKQQRGRPAPCGTTR